MHIDEFRDYCLAKKGVTESFPFDEVTLVFKVMGKMFALASLDNHPLTANLKCAPDWSVELRERYDGLIIPGYHMNKAHWNTVTLEGQVPGSLIEDLIDHSYQLVIESLPKYKQRELGAG